MKVTYYGHSCFMIEAVGKSLLFDPFITGNELAKDIDVKKIRPDFILISHGHSDHVGDAEEIAKRSNATVVGNYEVVTWLEEKGVKNTHSMNHGGSWKFDFGKVKYVSAIHTSSMPDGKNGGNPGGFIVETTEGNFYFAGDTALHMDMQLIPRFTKLDLAFLPIGDNYTMGIDDAIMATDFINCSRIIGMHYDTFGFIRIDHKEAIRKFTAAGLELALMQIGETRDF